MSQTHSKRPSQQQIDDLVDLFKRNHLKKALSKTTDLNRKYPEFPFLINFLGAVLAGLGRYEDAIPRYQQAIA